MNLLTVCVVVLITSLTLGGVVHTSRDWRGFSRSWSYRCAITSLVAQLGLELLLLAVDYRAPLSDRHVWPPLLMLVLSAESGYSRRWRTRTGSLPYAYTPSRQDVRLVLLALTLPGAALLAVFIVVVAHAFTAHP